MPFDKWDNSSFSVEAWITDINIWMKQENAEVEQR